MVIFSTASFKLPI